MKFDLKKKLTLFSSTDKVEMPSLNHKKFFKKNNFSSNINFLNVLKPFRGYTNKTAISCL